MREFKIIVNKKEVTFNSHLSDAEAIKKLKSLHEEGKVKIAKENAFLSKLVSGERLSGKQIAWVHKLVLDHSPKARKSAYPAIEKLKRLIGNRKLSDKSEEFALDLICASRKGALSEKQKMWVDKLAGETEFGSASPLPEKLKNPLTGRPVLVTITRAREIAAKMSESDVPLAWRKVIASYKKTGEAIAFKT